VVLIREAHPLWGARRIAKELRAQGKLKVPALSTITAILSRRGLLHKKPDLAVLDWVSSAPDKKVGFIKKLGLSIRDEPDISIDF
jgi:hypothetical protein